MTFISSTPGKIKNPSRLPNLIILPKTAAARGSSKSLEATLIPAGRRLRKAGFLALSKPGLILGSGLLRFEAR
jgi:hypothetical protein